MESSGHDVDDAMEGALNPSLINSERTTSDSGVPGQTSNEENPSDEESEDKACTQIPSPLCVSCNNIAIQHCAGCQNARYCSKLCQERDWSYHKLLCKTFKDFQERLSKQFYRAILFPVNETRPRFIWFEIDEDGISLEQSDEIFGNDKHVGLMDFDCHRPLRRSLGYTVRILHNDAFLSDGSRPNMAIMKLNGVDNASAWRDSFIAFGEVDEESPLDLDTTILATLMDFFKFRAKYPHYGYGFGLDLDCII